MIPPDRVYADPGDRMAGRYDPPRLCVVVTQWGQGGGPRNVAVRYLDNGQTAVIPFARRLRRVPSPDRNADRNGGFDLDFSGLLGRAPDLRCE